MLKGFLLGCITIAVIFTNYITVWINNFLGLTSVEVVKEILFQLSPAIIGLAIYLDREIQKLIIIYRKQ